MSIHCMFANLQDTLLCADGPSLFRLNMLSNHSTARPISKQERL